MKLNYHQRAFGKAVAARALKRFEIGDVKLDPSTPADSDSYAWVVRGRPELGDRHEIYDVRIKKGLSNPAQLGEPENASCTCTLGVFTTPRKYNQCSHILACDFHRLSQELPEGENLAINEYVDLGGYDFNIEVDSSSAIFLKKFYFKGLGRRWDKDRYINLGERDAWKDHFYYKKDNKTFYLKIKAWNSLIKAVEFLDKYTKVFFDMEFFITYLKPEAVEKGDQRKIEELAKNVKITTEGDRILYFFHEGFEKHCTFKDIISFKKWGYTQKYKNKRGFMDEFFKEIKPIKFEREKTESSRNNTTFFSTSIGCSPLFNRFLREKGFIISEPAPSIEPYQFTLKPGTEPRGYQHEAVDAWNHADNIGLIVAPSAAGKTYMGAMAIATKGVKTLILVHTKDLIGQWKESLSQFLDIQNKDIGIYAAGKKEVDNKKIIIATYQTLLKNLNEIKKLRIGMVIADECHHVPADTFQKVNEYIGCSYRLGLTATPERPDEKDGGILAFYNKIVYESKTQELINEKYISPVIFYTLNLKDNAVSEALSKEDNTTIAQKLPGLSAKSEVKHEAMQKLIEKIKHQKMCFIVFADRIEAAEKVSSDLDIPFLSADLSKDAREEIFKKMREREIPGIVTAKLAGEGVDIPNLDVVVDLVPYKSNTMLLQKIGRIRRLAEKKKVGIYIQFVLENVKIEKRWADAAYQNYIKDIGLDAGMFAKRRLVDSADGVKFGIGRTLEATEQRRRDLIRHGEKTEQELLDFLRANPNAYIYMISKKLSWNPGTVAKAMQRLEKKGLILREYFVKKESIDTDEPQTIIYIDGACAPKNPGGVASYGMIAYHEGIKVYDEAKVVGEGEGMSNNYAEYSALCAALRWLQTQEDQIRNGRILIRSDSQLVVNQIEGLWESHGGMYEDKYLDASDLAKDFKNLRLKWIPREENSVADALSRKAYEEYCSSRKNNGEQIV